MSQRCRCTGPHSATVFRTAPIQGALEAAVLVACAEAPRYGYEIAAWLTAEGLVTGAVSPGRLYETLGSLADKGAVAATEEPSDKGPTRRRYHLTEIGDARLEAWLVSLNRSEEVLARQLARARSVRGAATKTSRARDSDTHQPEGGEPMPCQCKCGGRHAANAETPTGAPVPATTPARSVEERLESVETLLERLSAR